MILYQKILNKIDWIINSNLSRRYRNMPGISVQSFDESVDLIIKNQSSLARFGDGEFSLMLNGEFMRTRNLSLRFQDANSELKRRLTEIIKSDEAEKLNIRIAISSAIVNYEIEDYTEEAWHFWRNFLVENRYKIYRLLNKNYLYSDTLITRFYMDYKDKSQQKILHKVKKLKEIWNGMDLLIVEGTGSRLGLNNDLFDNVASIKRIACPDKNAFDRYAQILNATQRFGVKKLILIALGPTATVLAFDLAKEGFRALDLGHIDIEYEWFLRGTHTKTFVEGKIMTEAHSNAISNMDSTMDRAHLSQIIHSIK